MQAQGKRQILTQEKETRLHFPFSLNFNFNQIINYKFLEIVSLKMEKGPESFPKPETYYQAEGYHGSR